MSVYLKKNISKIDISRIFDKYGLVLSKVLHKKDSIFTKILTQQIIL